MFYSDNYTWSSAVMLSIMAGGQLGQVDPLLIVHGDHDQAIPVQDARRAHAAAGSGDKQLPIFTQAEGGTEHLNADDPDPARQLIADWFADRLTTIPARPC
ncbi:MAG: hypothetical protein QOC62_4980 [Mycobacterium sp.]|nr:hypothetical protein [Mycobacterium sp.]